MAEEPKKEHKLPSMLEMSEMFDKVQSQMNPLSYNFEKLNSVEGIASQYEHLNPAISIEEIARKTFEQQNLASVNAIASSVSAGLTQPQIREAIALQDSFRKIAEGLSMNNNVMLGVESATQGMDRNNVYKDAMASFSQFRKSLKPLRDSLNTAGNAFNGSEFANLVKELQTSRVIPESTLSEYSGIFKQFESLHNLESFKAITRLKNFPFEGMVRIDLDSIPDLEENISETIVELDSEISDELSLVDDFNELSEEKRTVLLGLYQVYYYPIILNCLFILMWLQVFLDEKLDLTKNTFIFVEKSKEKLSYISNAYRPNPSAMIDNFVVGGFLMLLAKALGW